MAPANRTRMLTLIGSLTILLLLTHQAPRPLGPSQGLTRDGPAVDPRMLQRAAATEDLAPYVHDPSGAVIPPELRTRAALLDQRPTAASRSDALTRATLNSVLASEAFERAARLTTRWLDWRDPATGLFPHTLRPSGRYWSYGDVGADLFPFLGIATHQLLPHRYGEILDTLAAERGLRSGFPLDVMLDTLELRAPDRDKQMLRNVEYAKDGLLSLVERLGPDPWLARMEEVVDSVTEQSSVTTAHGGIPSAAAEVNGSLLQVLARLSWGHGETRDLELGRRISAAYLDQALPRTGWIPPQVWDFSADRPIGTSILHLGDHGDEIISGLVEWHRVETAAGWPEAPAHREAMRRMLDRVLASGRTPEGLWIDAVDYPSGRTADGTLNDNWGYLGQAYLNHSATLRGLDESLSDIADRYEQATLQTLGAVAQVAFHSWEHGSMDGYADSLESALYLLAYLDSPEAAAWLDRQMGVLYGFQHADGAVTDQNIDGNYIRTVLLYGLWLTQGVRLDPWVSEASLGAAAHGGCLIVHLHAEVAWSGRLLFDTDRHVQHLQLPEDYPRLNQWPEWWPVLAGRAYSVTRSANTRQELTGSELAMGLPVSIEPGQALALEVCRE